MALCLPSLSEADVGEANAAPNQERGHTGQVDNVFIGLACARRNIHHAQCATCICKHDRGDGHTPTVRPAQNARRFAVLAHKEEGS